MVNSAALAGAIDTTAMAAIPASNRFIRDPSSRIEPHAGLTAYRFDLSSFLVPGYDPHMTTASAGRFRQAQVNARSG
jgi:hypothetical protein